MTSVRISAVAGRRYGKNAMSIPDIERLRSIKTFPSLVKYLRDELEWPIESESFEDLTFDYVAEELGLDPKTAVKVKEIKQLRPLVTNQPWGIFFINFEPKQLPVVVLRRILRALVLRKRQSANKPQQATWNLHDLLFISSYGETDHRDITFAHFAEEDGTTDLPALRVLGWDDEDTVLHLADADKELREKLRWPDDTKKIEEWRKQWSSTFTLRPREVIGTSKALAERLAELATAIRKRVNRVLPIESESGPLRKLMTAFREALIHDLKEDDFADMYAQTITYGLLSERISPRAKLFAKSADEEITITNPFLRDMLSTFLTVGGRKGKIDFDELGINDVVQTLRDTDMEAVVRDFGDKDVRDDPVIYFYELFLKEYDPVKRIKRGVFFTPRPVVSFIVRSVDEILRKEFGLADGLADTTTWGEMVKRNPELKIPKGAKPEDPFVQILDPACGTGTFLVEVIDTICWTMKTKWRKQGHMELEIPNLWNEYVSEHLLPRLYGFELMMAPYAIAHMKIGLKLHETGYSFRSHERARIYLTNSLEPPQDLSDRFEFDAPALAHEAQAVNAIKRSKRFAVVIGNPPYAGISANRSDWITSLINAYRQIDGIPLEEKKIWVKNDYVKFLRFAQWVVDNCGSGIVGFITDHSYLDSPTFRGMRHSFMESASAISVLNLHGNSKRREKTPDGCADENVFDITQGVAISLLLKRARPDSEPQVRYADLWGLREEKYRALIGAAAHDIGWQPLSPKESFFEFVPVAANTKGEYEQGWRINEVFVLGSNGVQTSRDGLVIAPSKPELVQRFAWIRDGETRDADIRAQLAVEDHSFWKLPRARSRLAKESDWKDNIQPYLYRPFDQSWLFASPHFVHRLRQEVMSHLQKPNVALCVGRAGLVIQGDWNLVFCSDRPCDHNLFYRGSSLNFPLYIYRNLSRHLPDDLFEAENHKLPNLAKSFVQRFASKLQMELSATHPSTDNRHVCAEEIFHYAYAVFHSPNYRRRYAESLKTDFPRLPQISSVDLFRALAKLGGELVALHLMESPNLDKTITKYAGKGDSEVAKGHPRYSGGTVLINPTKGFAGVPEDVWNFHIGGYQVCEKWLKDRRGRVLCDEDIAHYQKIVVALSETIRLMAEIDQVIEAHGGWPGAFLTGKPSQKGSPE
jgi:predicted helicase